MQQNTLFVRENLLTQTIIFPNFNFFFEMPLKMKDQKFNRINQLPLTKA